MTIETLYFTADAALIDRLGRELVGKQETALTELVKNSYDADATEVSVTFERNSLVIDDDGSGMTRVDLTEGFLRLASDLKIREPFSARFRRRRAGRKGIGRFSTQRLGSKLVLCTWDDVNAPGLRLTINWQDFARGQTLNQVPVQLEAIAPRHTGTRVEIYGLRDSWSDAQIRRCWRGVLNLQQPFPVAPVFALPDQDPGFKVTLSRSREILSGSELIANLDSEVLNHMHAIVEFEVDTGGKAKWRMVRNRFGNQIDWTPISHVQRDQIGPSPYAYLRRVWGKAYYAILDAAEFSPMVFSRLRDLLSREGGIRLYRNGFRVVPYGEADNDWLRLDEAYSKRSLLVPIANRNWFGVIELHDPEGDSFEEPTSREGLIETPAFIELREFTSSVLITAATRIAEQRERKTRAGGSNTEPTEFYLKRLREASRKAREGQNDKPSDPTDLLLKEAEQIIESATSHFADEAAMLRLLATLGLTAAEFSHETGMTFQAVRLDFTRIFEAALEARTGDSDFINLVDRARSMLDRLDALTSYLNELASARSARSLAPVSVSRIIEDFARGMRQLSERSDAKLTISTPEFDGLYTTPMHQAEVASILLNFYSNSIKAMKRVTGLRRIHIEAEREDGVIVLRFSDCGDGILVEHWERVFDLFFTTRTAAPTSASTVEESTGTGLGLWIVRQITSRVEGSVAVVDAVEDFATTIEVRLPADEEIEDD